MMPALNALVEHRYTGPDHREVRRLVFWLGGGRVGSGGRFDLFTPGMVGSGLHRTSDGARIATIARTGDDGRTAEITTDQEETK